MMNRRNFLKLAGLSAASIAFAGAARAAGARRANVLMIFADDFGYGDLGCYGSKLVPTPNIDKLAAGGVRCTSGYVTMNVCSPSRHGLMTGSYQQRFGIQNNQDRNAPSNVIPPEHKLMPEAFKAAGYVTGHIGKWNVKRDPKIVFDEVHSLIDWEADYFADEKGHYIGVDGESASGKKQGVWRELRDSEEYLTDRLGRHAVEFIDKHQGESWFLYLAFNAVHSPWQAETKYKEKLAAIPEPLRYYAAMVMELDENVGKVLDKLRETGLEENTVVGFVSDNGPAFGSPNIVGWREDWPKDGLIMGSAGPLSGHKAQFYEGGIREPFILRWPGGIKAGAAYERPVMTMDLYPTFCAAAGVSVPAGTKLDGVNLLPFVTGEKSGDPHEKLYWKAGNKGALREGDWKLLIGYAPAPQLFNLQDDVGEKKDLAADQADRARKMFADWKAWGDAMPAATSTLSGAGKKGKAKAGAGKGKKK